MTLECIETRPNDTVIMICEETSRPIASLKLRVQIGLMLSIGCFCLIQGLRLLYFPDPLGTMTGLALLLPVPSCCYFGWRDYRALKQGRAGRSLRTRQLPARQLPVGAR
jgi:hypothetical protein